MSAFGRACAVVLFACGAAAPAAAVDTIETFDRGATDFEMYLAREGMGLDAARQSLGTEMVLGYGITERLSAHMGAALAADGHLLNGGSLFTLGVFGTVLDTPRFDVDLAFACTGAGDGSGDFSAGPVCEVNWDASPDQSTWGLYGRSGLDFHGRQTDAGPERLTDLHLAAGVYWSATPDRQFLLEYGGAFARGDDRPDERAWRAGGLALGLNQALSDSMEMITQVCWCPGEDGAGSSVGAMVGFIATLPAGGGGGR